MQREGQPNNEVDDFMAQMRRILIVDDLAKKRIQCERDASQIRWFSDLRDCACEYLAASSASAIDRRKWSIRAERASLRELSSFEYNHQSEEGGEDQQERMDIQENDRLQQEEYDQDQEQKEEEDQFQSEEQYEEIEEKPAEFHNQVLNTSTPSSFHEVVMVAPEQSEEGQDQNYSQAEENENEEFQVEENLIETEEQVTGKNQVQSIKSPWSFKVPPAHNPFVYNKEGKTGNYRTQSGKDVSMENLSTQELRQEIRRWTYGQIDSLNCPRKQG